MSLALALFAGPPDVLARFEALLPVTAGPLATCFWLLPGAELAVLPLTEALHDALHRANGTGDWLDTGARLTTSDLAFAAGVSRTGPLAYLETDGVDGDVQQSALVWASGTLVLGPLFLSGGQAVVPPRHLWPINAALRGLGLRARAGSTEFDTFGLGQFGSNEAILSFARPVGRR